MRTLMLGSADFRILMAAMTLFALLVVLLLSDGPLRCIPAWARLDTPANA
jgi:hypothetical protein